MNCDGFDDDDFCEACNLGNFATLKDPLTKIHLIVTLDSRLNV